MKKIILLLAVVLMSGAAMAQGPRGEKKGDVDPKARAEKVTNRMAEELSLTDAQKQKVLQLNLTRAEERAANRDTERVNRKSEEVKAARQEMKQQRETAGQAYDAQLKSILTPEQYTKFTELKAQRGDKGKGKACKQADGKKCNKKGEGKRGDRKERK